jgi:hypothetical protein
MSYLPGEIRQRVMERAKNRCEYCLIHTDFMIYPAEIDHIYARKHGGTDAEDNLCLSCFSCNRYKGSDIATLHPDTDEIIRLFHPRRDDWLQHFSVNRETAIIETKSDTGLVTARLLRFNAATRIKERKPLIAANQYP